MKYLTSAVFSIAVFSINVSNALAQGDILDAIYGHPSNTTIPHIIAAINQGTLDCNLPPRPGHSNSLLVESFGLAGEAEAKALAVACLKQHSVNLHSRDAAGRTVLHLAAMRESPDLLKLLLKNYNFNLDAPNGHGATPIIDAIDTLSVENVRIIRDAGATIDQALAHAKVLARSSPQEQRFQEIVKILSSGPTKKL